MKYYLILACLFPCLFLGASVFGSDLSKSTPDLVAKGLASYTTNCVVCHGDKADGNGPAGAAMNPKPRNLIIDKFKQGMAPKQLFDTLTKGVKGTSMTPFVHLKEDERWALVHYVLSLRKK